MSSMVRLIPHATPPFIIHDRAKFSQVVMAAFSQRRKTLRNALSTLMNAEQIEAAGINPGLRAEVLSPDKFAALAEQIK
jgi:16S rRNA (adenine1518-N6/adenine1519-N6)-dimethyltransferase